LNLIFGYNGLGRITGQETGSITGGNVALGSQWGPTGLFRMFNAEFGGQASWLIPLALLSLVGVLFATRRAKRTDLLRASAVIWGGWLVVTDLLFSLSKGIIHQYYTVALAPGIGALVGLGAYVAYERRDKLAARIMAAIGIAGSAVWAAVLLGRTPTWQTWIKPTVLVAGLVSAVAIIAWPKLNRSLRSLTMAGALVAMLLGPVAYVVATSTTPHTGSLPTAGPVGASSSFGGGPGGAGGLAGALPPGAALRGRLGSQSLAGGIAIGGKAAGANAAGGRATGSAAGARSATGQFGPGGGIGGVPPTGAFPGVPPTGAARTGGAGSGLPSFGGAAGGRFGFPGAARGGAGGSLLDASAPSKALTALLNKDSSKFTWIVATVGSQSASGYQLATGSPVMAIGGFNGSDPAPSLATFIADVKAGKIHYFISSGGGGGGPSAGGTVSTEITTWVTKHFTAKTVDGVSVYDLTAPKGAL
jgi:4-amino-4-deoxy-L-arabinose transferase-like glycosyltransferase